MDEQAELIDQLVRACINLYAELGMVEIEGGLRTLEDFSLALNAMPQASVIREKNKQRLERALALMMAEPR